MRWLWRADPPFQQSQFQPNPKPVAAGRHIIWLAATLVALSGLAVATTLYVLRGEALHTGKKLTRSLAQVIEEQTSRTLQAADQRLQLAAVRLDALKTERQLNRDTADAMLREQLKELPFASAIWVLDQDGRIAFDSTPGNTAVSLADRDYFKVYQQRPDAGFYVSAPVRSRTNNRWIVAVARPLRTLAGGFSGVIVASLDPSYFDTLWREIDLGHNGAVAMFRRDGILMMRSPMDEASMGKGFASRALFTEYLPRGPRGSIITLSPVDGQERFTAFRTLPAYSDLIVTVGSPPDSYLGAWTRFAVLSSLIWLAAAAAIALLSMQLARQARQRRQTEQRFHQLAQAMPQLVFIVDAKGEVHFMNEQWTIATGLPVEAALGRGWVKVLHPDDLQDSIRVMAKGFRSGSVIQHEHRMLFGDGSYRWRLMRAVPNRDHTGQVTSWCGTSTDIDELKRAESALQEQAALMRVAERLARMGSWVIELPERRIVWSDEASNILDLPAGTPASVESVLAMCAPQSLEATTREVEQCLRSGGSFDVEVEMITARGRRVWVRSIGQAVRDAQGAIVRMQGAQQDITARVEAEYALKAHLLTLHRVAEAAQAITQHQSLDALVREVAEQVRTIIGARRATVQLYATGDDSQRGFAVSRLENDPPDRQEDEDPTGALAVGLTGRDGRSIGILQLSGKSQGSFDQQDAYVAAEIAQFAAIAIDNVKLLAEVRDLNNGLEKEITRRTGALARQEALFRALAEQAPLPIWTVDLQGRATFLSRAWYALVGGSPPDWHGSAWLDVVHPDDLPGMTQNWLNASRSGGPYTGTRRLKAHDGNYHTTSYRATPVRNEAGEIEFWVGIDTDITELKAVESALRRSNAELESFSYSVSHDLRSPLSAVDGFSHLLAKELSKQDGEQVRHYITRILAGVGQMGQLIDGLLSLAQVLRVELRHGAVDLGTMAGEILERLQAGEPARVVSWQVEPGLHAEGDNRLLRSVMENLLGNAWKFSERQPRAEITVGQLSGQGVFFVRDNGAGFDMTYANKLFGTFQRLHSVSEFTGTGIGLATAARVIARHGGRIWAESAPGHGATFFFTLQDAER